MIKSIVFDLKFIIICHVQFLPRQHKVFLHICILFNSMIPVQLKVNIDNKIVKSFWYMLQCYTVWSVYSRGSKPISLFFGLVRSQSRG